MRRVTFCSVGACDPDAFLVNAHIKNVVQFCKYFNYFPYLNTSPLTIFYVQTPLRFEIASTKFSSIRKIAGRMSTYEDGDSNMDETQSQEATSSIEDSDPDETQNEAPTSSPKDSDSDEDEVQRLTLDERKATTKGKDPKPFTSLIKYPTLLTKTVRNTSQSESYTTTNS